MMNAISKGILFGAFFCIVCRPVWSQTPAKRYFAHPAVEDRHGVIAPWYQGLGGQCDFRVRVAAETLKRYPWAPEGVAVTPGPCFVFSGHWAISPEGEISPKIDLSDWDNGDLGQRSSYILAGLVDYYRYAGDPAAIGLMTINIDYLLDYCQTAPDHSWPGFLISCPTKGKAYGRADPTGLIQLDYTCQVGLGVIEAYQLTGNERYLRAVTHWADLLAQHCNHDPGAAPWGRYANPECVPWKEHEMTGGVSLVLLFLDEVIRLGHRGEDDAVVKARDAGERYLREQLLPKWTEDATWGRRFWDWPNHVNAVDIPGYVAGYMMDHPDRFPNWRCDARNILTLFMARATVDPASRGGVYSGAWAVPESSGCCGLSLQYPTQLLAAWLARYGEEADSVWARELARRMILISTYDAHENGVVEDLIDGGPYVAVTWFNLAHPFPLKYTLDCMAWQPEWLGAARENHIMRSASVVSSVVYDRGRVEYKTSAAEVPCVDVLRLAFEPTAVTADGAPLEKREELDANGFMVRPLENGDCIVTIRHDGLREIVVAGDDPQEAAGDEGLEYTGDWKAVEDELAQGGSLHVAEAAGAQASFAFEGNQVRLIGRADPDGGKADVFVDGVKQPAGLDCWCPQRRDRQVLYYKNGLAQGNHTLQVVVRGEKNPLSSGEKVYLDGVQWSAATGESGSGSGGGPEEPQRVIFGYKERTDYVDSAGHAWRPATEVAIRLGHVADLVPLAFWTEPRAETVAGTDDPELYRFGMYGPDFTAFFTVAPEKTYHVRVKLAELQKTDKPGRFATTIEIQGKEMVRDLDIAATAGGIGKAVDLVFNDIRPEHGVISVRFHNPHGDFAAVQAIEVGPGTAEGGAEPVPFVPEAGEPE